MYQCKIGVSKLNTNMIENWDILRQWYRQPSLGHPYFRVVTELSYHYYQSRKCLVTNDHQFYRNASERDLPIHVMEYKKSGEKGP